MIVTDHFVNGNSGCAPDLPWSYKMNFIYEGFSEAFTAGNKCGLDVFFGWEYNIDGADILTYGLGIDFLIKHPEMEWMTMREYSTLIRSNGGYLAQAHPIRHDKAQDPRYLDGYEVWNSTESIANNNRARGLAKRFGLIPQAGSDSHGDYVSFQSGISMNRRAKTIHDIIDALKNGKATPIMPRL
jgi:hypothetical protein